MDKLSVLQQGISIAIIGIGIVFLSLIFIFFFMKLFVFISNRGLQKRDTKMEIRGRSGKEPMSGELAAAISMAIHLSRGEFHDLEQAIITF